MRPAALAFPILFACLVSVAGCGPGATGGSAGEAPAPGEEGPAGGTQVRYVLAGAVPEGYGPEDWLGADGGLRLSVDLAGRGERRLVQAWGEEIHLPGGRVLQAGADVSSLLSADLDGDGDLDLLSTTWKGPTVLWRNDGEGGWGDGTEDAGLGGLLTGADTTLDDVDGDGDLDLLWVSMTDFFLLRNTAPGRYEQRRIDQGGWRVTAADWTGDGCTDVVLCSGEGAWFQRGGCDGTFRQAEPLGTTGAGCLGLLAVDHDNDGLLDLIVVEPWPPSRVLRNTGDGNFVYVPEVLPSLFDPKLAYAADVDGDGDLDLVFRHPNSTEENHRWMRNDGGNALGWILLDLQDGRPGVRNPDGIGSMVAVQAGSLLQTVRARGRSVHLGLGDRKGADMVEITWPDGAAQRLQGAPLHGRITGARTANSGH